MRRADGAAAAQAEQLQSATSFTRWACDNKLISALSFAASYHQGRRPGRTGPRRCGRRATWSDTRDAHGQHGGGGMAAGTARGMARRGVQGVLGPRPGGCYVQRRNPGGPETAVPDSADGET